MSRIVGLLMITMGLASSACEYSRLAGYEDTNDAERLAFEPFGTVTVQAAFDINGAGSNIDQIAFWEAPDPDDTLMFVSAKGNHLIEVWHFPFVSNEQTPLTHSSLNRLNGVSSDNQTDILYAATRSAVQMFSLPDLQLQGTINEGGGTDDTLPSDPSTTILNLPSGEARLYTSQDREILIHNAETGVFIGRFDTVTGIEGIAADDFYQLIYTLDEGGTGVHVYDPDGAHVANFGNGDFQSDGEGILIYSCRNASGQDDGRGLIVASDQIGSQTDFEFYDRQTGEHLGILRLVGVSNTDGIASTQEPLPGYPMGLFAAINNDRSTAGVGWDVIFNATGLSCF